MNTHSHVDIGLLVLLEAHMYPLAFYCTLAACRASWYENKGRCYRILEDATNWYQGVSRCQDEEADMLVINSQVKFLFI